MVKKKAKAKANLNLPGDIIEANILTRLPVETLLRFAAVCKSWYSLLSHPYFINIHHHFQIHNNKITLTDDIHENHIVATHQSQSFFSYTSAKFSRNWVTGVGYSHGIVCVLSTSANSTSQQQQLSLWNPALRTKKIVDICNDHQYVMSIGFGYHTQTNDYKVIKLVHDLWTIKFAEIYSLTSDSWRKIDHKLGAAQYFVVDSFGVYLSLSCGGAYCWIGCIRDSDEEGIISFDMEEDAFKVMLLPYTRTTDGQSAVFIYHDSLAVLYTHPNRSSSHLGFSKMCYIWVMKVYNNPESWTMLFKFDTQPPCVHVSFVGVTETERIVLSCLYRGNMMSKEAIEIDIGKSRKKTVSFPTQPFFISSFTQSLALLKEVQFKNSP